MRLLYSFPHAIGAPGIGTTALHQVLGLLDQGHDVTVMATSAHKRAPPLPKFIATMTLAGVRVPHRVLGVDNAMAFHDACAARLLSRRLDAFDLVHCWPGATLATARAAMNQGVPALREVPNTHTENAYEVVGRLCAELGVELPPGASHRYNGSRLARERKEYETAFRLLVPSASSAESFRVRGFPAEKLLRHRYGYDPAAFSPGPERAPGPLRAVFLGGVGPRKGLHVALEAWTKSRASKDGSLACYGRVEAGYRSVIAPYLDAPGVELHEFTTDANRVLQSSDVLLLPSFEEGSALVTYEAQGCGVIPLVSHAAGAVCVDGVTGLVHPSGDVDALVRHLDLLSADPERRQKMRHAILARRHELTWAAAAERLETCYESARAAARVQTGRPREHAPARRAEASSVPSLRSAGARKRDLVFTFWNETWTDSVFRQFMTPDRLAQALLTRPEVGGLLYADSYRMGLTQFVRRLQGRRPAEAPKRAHPTGVVSPVRLRRKDGMGEASLRRTYAAYDRRLRAAADKLGLERPAVITTNPFYAAFAPLEWAGPVTYFAYDDWAAHDAFSRWSPDFLRAYAEIRRRSHRVCAVSQHLLDRIDPAGPALVVPNGVMPDEWQAPCRAPDWLADLPKPHILYAGAIHSRLDMAAIREVAARFPHGSLLFVGPTAHEDVANELRRIPGVHVWGALTRELIVGLTRAADVCIMPHQRTPLTASMSPLKIYEYCAAGRPSAATDMPPVQNIHKQVVLVPEGASFADGVERALALGPMAEAERQAFVQANAWRGRHDSILGLALDDLTLKDLAVTDETRSRVYALHRPISLGRGQ